MVVQVLFYVIAGLLSGIGLLLGFNYEEISVYLCIYFWVALMFILSLIPTIRSFAGYLKKQYLKTFLISTPLITLNIIWYCIGYKMIMRYHNLDGIKAQFALCQDDLALIARHTHQTYEQVNLMVYVGAPILFIGFYVIVFYLVKRWTK